MKVKAADIAKKLNVSKASVSFALNNKPGVSDELRAQILACKAEMAGEHENKNNPPERKTVVSNNLPVLRTADPAAEEAPASLPTVRQTKRNPVILVVVYAKGNNSGTHSELIQFGKSLEVFEETARKNGRTLSITYFNPKTADFSELMTTIQKIDPAGVLLAAGEMSQADYLPFSSLNIPMVIYGNDLGSGRHCIHIDNQQAVHDAFEKLISQGSESITFLWQAEESYNFNERREAFFLSARRHPNIECRELQMSGTIEQVYTRMKQWLDNNPLPDAFIFESSPITIGAMQALQEKGIRIPQDLKVISLDEVPAYMTGGKQIDAFRFSPEQMPALAMELLEKAIKHPDELKYKVSVAGQFLSSANPGSPV